MNNPITCNDKNYSELEKVAEEMRRFLFYRNIKYTSEYIEDWMNRINKVNKVIKNENH